MENINIEELLAQAKAFENTDDYDKAVSLYKKVYEHYKEAGDFDNAIYCLNRKIRVLKHESEFYKVAENHLLIAELHIEHDNIINAARHFSRAGVSYMRVSGFTEAARAYERAGDMFFKLEGEFFIEAAKHYKLSALNFVNIMERQLVDYQRAFDKVLLSYEKAKEINFIGLKNYLVYLANFYTDAQETLSRNGFYREEKTLYIKKMDYTRLGYKIDKRERWRYLAMSVWKYSCLYGESPLLWLGWIFVHMFTFSMIYFFGNLVHLNGSPISFGESIFFSVNVFATLGFGSYDLVSDVTRFMVGLDVITGYFMTAMLITVFTRRLTR